MGLGHPVVQLVQGVCVCVCVCVATSCCWLILQFCFCCIGCLKLQVVFRKRATNDRALLQKMRYKDIWQGVCVCVANSCCWLILQFCFCYVLKRALYFFKRALYFFKRALYFFKRALYFLVLCVLCMLLLTHMIILFWLTDICGLILQDWYYNIVLQGCEDS